jgi:tetratricopeptide (TPR) repeat protein
MKLFDRGGLAEALEKFEQADAEYASPKLFFNIGQANRDLGRPVEAIEYFERFLTEVKAASTELIFWGLAGAATVTTGILFFIEGRPVTVARLAGQTTSLLAIMRY